MANNLIQIKRTSVSGRVANTLTLPNPGELALNMTDGILYSTNGSNVFEIGANNTNVNVSNTITIKSLSANGSNGTLGQVLTSNGSTVYWNDPATFSVNLNAQYVWTNTHTFTNNVTLKYASVGNSTVNTEISAGYISVGNSTTNTQISPGIVRLSGSEIYVGNDVLINSASVFVGNVNINFNTINVGNVSVSTNNIVIEGRYVLTSDTAGVANDAYHLGGVAAADYQTTAGLATNVATLTANNTNFVGTVSAANVVSNAQLSANLGNYQTTAGLSDNVATLTANNTSFVGSISAANVVSNAQLSANLGNYQTTAGLASNVATLTANNTNFVGDVSAANVVSNAQLSANLGNYQTTAGLAGNVAKLTANNSSYAFGKTEDALNVNSAYNANNSAYLGGVAAASYQTTAGLAANVATLTSNNSTYAYGKTESSLNVNSALTSNSATYLGGNTASDLRTYTDNKSGNAYTNAVSYVDGKSYVNTAQLSGNLSNYAQLAGATFTGNVSANNGNTLYDFTVGRNLVVSGNLTVTGNVTTIGANNLSIVDNFIYLNSNNDTNNIDIGFAGNYNDGVYRHTGFFRDASDGYWKVFDGYVPEPDANVNIDTANNTFKIADFWANTTRVGNTTVYSTVNSTAFSGTANNATNFGGNAITNFVRTTGNYSLTGNIAVNNIIINSGLNANGSYGNAGQILVSNGSGGVYWSEDQVYGNVIANAVTVNILTVNFVTINNGSLSVGNSTVNTDIGNNYISVGNNNSYSNIYSGFMSIGNSVINTVINSSSIKVNSIFANGSLGTAGQILASNGTGIYWSDNQNVNAITANSLSANYVSVTRGTLTVGNSTVNTDIGNNYVSVGNSTSFVNVYSNRIIIDGATINSTVYTGVANPNLNASFSWTNNHSFSDIVTFNGNTVFNANVNFTANIYVTKIRANSSFGTAGQYLTTDGGAGGNVYWSTPVLNTAIAYNWTNNHSFSDIVTFNGNTIFNANANFTANIYVTKIRANSSYGTAGQFLTTDGGLGGNVYWSTPLVNTNLSYNWTNNHTFSDIVTFNGNTTFNANITIGVGARLRANGSFGTAGQVLASNGTGVYWTADQGANSLTANSLTANYVSITSGTLSVGNSTVNTDIGNNYISVGNTTGFTNIYSNYITIGNSVSNSTINSTAFTGTANNATYFGGNAIGNFVRTTGAHTLSGNITFSSNVDFSGVNGRVVFGLPIGSMMYPYTSGNYDLGASGSNWKDFYISGGIYAGAQPGAPTSGSFGTNGQVLTSNGSTVYWSSSQSANAITANTLSANYVSITSGTLTVGNSTVNTDIGNNYISVGNTVSFVNVYSDRIYIGNSAANATINSTIYTGTANNATLFGGNVITNFVRTSGAYTLSGNITFNGNVTIGTGAGINANGIYGTSGQVLTSNGSSVYWGTAVAINTASQYTWTNTQTFASAPYLNNDVQLRFKTVNSAAYSYFVQQSDDNFVFYTTNASYGARPIFNIYANSGTSAFSFGAPVAFTGANVSFSTGTAVFANGSAGTSGQLLASNGSAVYWVSPGAANVNTAAQYTWTNTHTFQANVSFTGNGIGLSTNTSAIYFGGIADANWKMGRNTGVVTKWRYTNNSIDIITANSNLEGFSIGLVSGNSYFETGYLGTFIASNVTIGNSASNATINSTTFSGTANNTNFVGSVSAVNVVSNAQLTSNLANYVTSTNLTNNLANYQTTAGLAANVATLTANNTSFVGTVSAANVVSNAQLSANLANYQTTAGLPANVATLTANNTSFVGTVSAANVVSNAQLSANLSNYQTTAGLAANVATLTANNTSFVGSVSAANVVSNAQLSANLLNYVSATNLTNNLANYQTTAGLAANVATLTANSANFIGTLPADNVVSNAQLSSNLANYLTKTGINTANANFIYYSNTSNTGFTISLTPYAPVGNQTFSFYSSGSIGGPQAFMSWPDGSIQTTAWTGANAGLVANSSGVFVNADYIATLTSNNTLNANNTTYFNGNAITEFVRVTGAYTVSGNLTFNGNLTIGSTAGINANGSYGSAGQVLTSNGTSVYWVSPGTASVDQSAQYNWTNTHTFTNTVFLNAISANGSLGGAGQVLTSNGSDTYWSTVSGGPGGGAYVSIGTSAPGSANAGDFWWNSEEGSLKIYYSDANTSQWVDASSGTRGANGANWGSRVVSYADATSITINADSTDTAVHINTQVAGTLTVNAPTGTIVDGQRILLRIKSTNVQTFSWNGIFQGSTDLPLPSVTSGANKFDYMGFIYNSSATKWQLLSTVFGF